MSVNFSILTSLLEQEHQLFVQHASKPASSQWKSLLVAFAKDLKMYVRPFGLKMKSSWGNGRWTYFPWIRLYFPEMSTDPKNGIFIDYLFGWEDHKVFLTLLQGVDGKLKNCPDEIHRIKKLVQTKVVSSFFAKSPFVSSLVANVTLSKQNRVDYKGSRAKSYAAGMIFHKKYTSSSLPEPSNLEADLKEIIRIYDEVRRLGIK